MSELLAQAYWRNSSGAVGFEWILKFSFTNIYFKPNCVSWLRKLSRSCFSCSWMDIGEFELLVQM